jgi:hypothetical protein
VSTIRLKIGELPGRLALLHKRIEAQLSGAVFANARDTAHEVAQNVPIAFGELRHSVHAEVMGQFPFIRGAKVIADAPHAAAVEVGSRPHWMPLAPLVKWVKLRGMQGLNKRGGVRSANRRANGNTTAEHAFRIASQIKSLERHGTNQVDDAEKIARAIQAVIAKRGTKPHFFMRSQIPFTMRHLDSLVKRALKRVEG